MYQQQTQSSVQDTSQPQFCILVLHKPGFKALKIIPCELQGSSRALSVSTSPHSEILLLQGSARPCAGTDPDAAVQELVLPGGLLSPANKPMKSISSQPEKASLTLCSSAQVDSLLLLVIWERVCRKKQKSMRTRSHCGVNALKLLGDTVTQL